MREAIMKNWLGSETPEARKSANVEPVPGAEPTRTEEGGILARGFKLEGTLEGSGPLRVDGEVKGTLRSKSRVVLGENARLEGETHCAFLSVAGKVNGNIYCTDRLEILRTGLVEGDVHTPSLGIEPGGILEGRCHMKTDVKPVPASKTASPAASVTRPSASGKDSRDSATSQN
jgi:cytoskeletal protein CcmA (bactofilin family)